MAHGKLFLVLSDPLPGFLGAARLYALSSPRDRAPVMAFTEVSANRKRHPEAIRAAALQAAQALCDREALDYEVATFLSSDPILEGLVFRDLPIILVDEDSLPADFIHARETVYHHTVAALELLERELPQIPFRAGDVEPHLEVLKRYGNPGTLYDVSHPVLAPTWHELTRRKKLLLHVCCGPDAAGVIAQLKRDYDVVGFWYDPNIQPQEEHDKRLEAFRQVAALEDIPLIEGEYDVERFMQEIKGLEHTPEQGAKCSGCYDLRLERAAVEAKRQGCDLYTTTLAISPHKVQAKLKNFGLLNERKHGIPYLARNFLKDDGFNDSVEYTRRHSIYRQDYCGCWYSLHEGGPEARQTAAVLGLTHTGVGENSTPPNELPSHETLAARHADLRRKGILSETKGAQSSDSGKNYG